MISFRSARRNTGFELFVRSFVLSFVSLWLPILSGGSAAQELGSARLQIAGTRLTVSPATQTVPLETSTLVETHLDGYDPDRGVLPSDLRVVADFTGPGLQGGLRLESFPNEPLRVPALRTKGEYFLENIRLMQGDDLLTYAEPRTASVLATQILISSISTRALTEDEIRSYGIVIGEDSRQAINLTFAFGFDGGDPIEYSMPVVFRHFGPEDWGRPAAIKIPMLSGRTIPTGRYQPPRPVPFKVELDRDFVRERRPTGGCFTNPCREEEPPETPMVGVVFFPAEMSLLHQFFSVVLMVQNGAPEGDPLTISDLTARIQVPSGLRQASTEPPTPLGVPVPVRVPGADGEVGTSDDLTLIVAQASGQAEFLVEGLEQGTHIVDFDMEGMLHGLPEGPTRISGSARGAVTVRDPTLSATINHPTVVRENAPYSAFFTVTNLGNQPVNGIEIKLPTSGLAGTRLADGETNVKDLGSLLPGESTSVEFQMVALLNGRLVATSTRAGSGVLPLFEFSLGVGNGIPLSPESISLPESVDELPPEFVVPAKGVLGLAHSLSTAPWELVRDKPQVTRNDVDERVYRLVEASRMYLLGEPLFETVAAFMSEWAGARDASWEWDELRRGIDPALELAEFAGATMVVTEPDADDATERFAEATYAYEPWIALARYGEIEVASRVSGKSSHGFLTDAVRDLPFAELLPLGNAEMAFITHPEEEGHRVVVRRQASGGADLRLILPPTTEGDDMRSIAWNAISLDAGGSAWVDVVNDGSALELQVDGDADGEAEYQIPGTETALAPRPFEAVAAKQNHDIDPSGHVVDVLFSRDVALRSLIPRDPDRFQIPGRESNGGITPTEQSVGGGILGIPQIDNPFEGLSNPRVVRVVFNNPLGPSQTHDVTVSDLESSAGEFLVSQTLPVQITVDQPGIRLEGTVIDNYGRPLPFARVTLYEQDLSGGGTFGIVCGTHPTAVAIADHEGRYSFDYVRQTVCSDVFTVRALAPGEPRWGEVDGRVRFPGQTQQLNIVMLGRATVEGRVTYEDGSAPVGLTVTARNQVLGEGRVAWTDDDGNYRMAEVAVGTVQLTAWDELGNRTFQTIEVPTAGATIERDLVLVRRQEGVTTGTVRGTVVNHSTSEPEVDAYVALYLDGGHVATQSTDYDGRFDFGAVPTGLVELQAFDGRSGLDGAQFFAELEPDEVIDHEMRLTDDRGTIIGRVVRVATDGTQTPVANAIVWVDGMSENSTTDSNGDYRLEDVVLGTHTVKAADLAANESVQVRVTLDSPSQEARADLYFRDGTSPYGAVTGTVLDRGGQPVSGAAVYFGGGYSGTRWTHRTSSDSAGRYRIDDVLPGSFAVHADQGQDGGISFGAVEFPGDVDDVTVQFAGGVLHGRTFYTSPEMLEVPVASTIYYRRTKVVALWSMVTFEPDWQELRTDADGTFEIPLLKGPYQLLAFNSFHGKKHTSGFFDEFTEEIELEFDRNGSISGTVLMHDGVTPAVGADVTLRGGTISDFTVQTDENGRFFFDLLKKGGYKLTAEHEPGAIFRTQRVWAYLAEAGDVLENVEIVLPKQGTVEGFVEDADGVRVPAAIVELSERSFPWRRIRQTTDGEGNYLFDNIFEGEVTLTAQAPELGGLGASGTFEITDEAQELQSLLTLEGVGSLRGTVLLPGTGGGSVANARVRLITMGKFHDATTSDLDGSFTFEKLPLGFYRIAVFDPTTGRHGEGDQVEITHHGHEANGDVTLEVRGIVDGHIYDSPSNQPVPGATIKLESWGIKWFSVYSSANTEGYFTFEGIPEGDFDISAKVDGRKAENSGEIVEEDEVVTRDLYLQALATVRGVVLGPLRADGTPGSVMEGVNVRVQDDRGYVVGAGTENPFVFDRLLPGLARVAAVEMSSGREVHHDSRLAEGDDQEIELVMRAMGSSTAQVLTSTGDPVPYARVRLVNTYSSRSGAPPSSRNGTRLFLEKTADENGWVTFANLHEGGIRVTAEDPITGLVGSEGALLTYEGEVVPIVVQLQPSGTIQGTVYMSDGVTPGDGITVALKMGMAWHLGETDSAGFFHFASMPLYPYELFAQDPEGPGSYTTTFSLQADQEVLDLSIVLDDEDPYVVSMTPTSMSRDLPVDTQVVLRFNESMAACTSCGSYFAFQRVQGGSVPFSVVWSENDTVATLIPNQPLASATTYRVRVKSSVADHAGRQIDPLFTGGLTTADIVPPRVIDAEPGPDSVQVPVNSTITLQFSEPVDVDSLSGAFQVTDLTTGEPITVTTLVRLDETGVVLTPIGDFGLDRQIEVRATGLADPAGNVQSEPFVMTFWTPDVTKPQVQWIRPSANQYFTAGDLIDFEVRVTDNQGTARVRIEMDEWTSPWYDAQMDPGPPDQPTDEVFSSMLPAPIRDVAGDVLVRTVAEDIWGNVTTSEQTIRVEPLEDQSAPVLAASCPADADFVAPGIALTTTLAVTDDLGIESAWLEVDGEMVDRVAPVFDAEATVSLTWIPDAMASSGQVFGLEFFVRDFAGNIASRQLTAQVPGPTVTAAGDPLIGASIFLAAGQHTTAGDVPADEIVVLDGATWTAGALDLVSATTKLEIQCGGVAELGEIEGATVRVESGAVLRTPRIEPTRITAALFEVEDGGLVDGVGRGYYGYIELHVPDAAYAPDGIPAPPTGGGSHGGRGSGWLQLTDQPVYDSVYVPLLSGAGGDRNGNVGAASGGNGGGSVEIRADQMRLDGRIDVRGHHGDELDRHDGAGGAGGSVLIDTADFSGAGRIVATGGDSYIGAGGGGRIAIHAESAAGFDPVLQTLAHGGVGNGDQAAVGAPGTVFLRTSDMQYGNLWIENRSESGDSLGAGRVDLPVLGSGSVTTSQAQGMDRWIFAASDFDVAWLGAWMRLEDAAGSELGTFRVLEVDETRVLLEGASAVVGASAFRGVYLFDEVHAFGAELQTSDLFEVAGEIALSGESVIQSPLQAGSITISPGSVITAQQSWTISGDLTVGIDSSVTLAAPWNVGGDVLIDSGTVFRPAPLVPLEIHAGGELTLAADAWINADGLGYPYTQGPEGVAIWNDNGDGGSHGGHGGSTDGAPGDVYDSVYLPSLFGGGARWSGGFTVLTYPGGGVVTLTAAADLVIEGKVSALGTPGLNAGAGGTIHLRAGRLLGTGLLDASSPAVEGSRDGAGGRIAIWTDELVDFDPEAQSRAWAADNAASGTVFVHTAASTFGRVIIDNGLDENGLPRLTPLPTVLPTLGEGAATSAVPEGVDLRLDLGIVALWRWAGAYVDLFDTSGTLLGEYRVAEPDGTTILVEGAGSLAAQVAFYRGIYRFDRVDILHGAQLDWPDATPVDEMVIGSETLVSAPIEARTIRLTGGAMLRPSGRHPIELRADESIIIEEGAVVDVSGMGYEGFGTYGTAPDGIVSAGDGAGGSYGGRGLGDAPGEVYGSVYYPSQSGGAGAYYAHGGGAISMSAPDVQLDGVLLASGRDIGYEGAGGSVRIEAGQLSGSGWIDASAPDDSYHVSGGGGRVALLVDTLLGFDPSAQVVAAGPRRFGYQPDQVAAAGTVFVRTSSSTYGELLVDNRRLDERDPADDIVRKAFQTELPTLGEGAPVAVTLDGFDLLVDLGETPKPRWQGAWVELLDADDSSLGVFEVGNLEGTSLRVVGAAGLEATVASYRGTYRFDRVDIRGGAGLETRDLAFGALVRFDGDAEFGGPWIADEYLVESGATVWPANYEPLTLDATTSITIESGATVSAVSRGFYDPYAGTGRTPENVSSGVAEVGSHGGFGLGADGELYGSVYFPRFAGSSAGDLSRGGGVISLRSPTLILDGSLDASAGATYWRPKSGGGTVAVDAEHLSGAGQILARGINGSGGGRVAIYATQTLDFDAATQASAAGGASSSYWRGGVGTVYVFGPSSTWGDLILDNDETGLNSQDDQPYTHLPRLGSGTVGLVEVDADEPADLWIEPSAAGIVFDLGVEGMWLRSGGSDYRILAEDGSRRRILLEGAAGLVQVGDAYSGLYRFDSVIAERSSYLRIDDASEVGTWNIDAESAVQTSSFAIDVNITTTDLSTDESVSFQISADFVDQELGQIHAATIDWGDGTVEQGALSDGNTGTVSGGHIWVQDGVYLVEICVADLDGREGCDLVEVVVDEVAPTVTRSAAETFEGWQQEDSPLVFNASGAGIWVLNPSEPGTVSSGARRASVFFSAAEGTHWEWSGQWKHPVYSHTSGLVLGFREGDAVGQSDTDYFIVVWSRADYGRSPGLKLYRVRGATDFWTFGEPTTELVAEAATLGETIPAYGVLDLKVRVTEASLQIFIEGVLEFDIESEALAVSDAGFGVWSHQASVEFLSLTKQHKVVEEGIEMELDGFLFTDPGLLDSHSATVDWGDGSPVEPAVVVESAGEGSVSTFPHSFAEAGSYSATVCVQDAGSGDCESILIEVTNMTPRIAGSSSTLDLGFAGAIEAATFFDSVPGVHTATVDWGDGAGSEAATVEVTAPGQGRVLVAPPQQVGQWQADVCVTDDEGATGCGVFDLTVEGVATPEVLSVAATGMEGSTTSLTATFGDTDPDDVHTATVDWGAGPVAATVDQATDDVTASTTFAENGTFPVTVCVTDLAGLNHCLAGTAEVANAAPVVTVAAATATADEGATLSLADASFTDAGASDTHTASIDWGDGTSESTTVTGGSGSGTLAGASHAYGNDGSYQIRVCAVDDDGGEGCDTVAVTVANMAPQVTSAGSVALDGLSEMELATYLDAGVADVHTATIDWADGTAVAAGTVQVTGAGQGRVLGIHDYAAGGVFDVQVCVTDDSAATSCVTVEVSSADSVAPTVSVSGVASSYSAGETLTATIDTFDEVGVERVEVTFDGATTTLTEGGPTFTYQTQVDPTLTTPRITSLDVVAYDFSGNASTPFSQSIDLGVDLPPDLTLTVTPDRPDGRYTSGEALTFVAEATDNVTVASLTIDVGGEVTSGSSPLMVAWTAPSVSQPTSVAVTAVATDDNGNSSTETLNLQIDPSANGIPPEVAFTCPTDGATLPSAYDLTLQLTATDDEGVSQVELYRDDEVTPFATAVPSVGGTLTFDVSEVVTLPTVTGAAQPVRLRAVASDAGFNYTSTEITVQVVETVDLLATGNDWTALAGSIGVLRSGTLEIDQPRTLGGLIVLDGATVTHTQPAPGAATALDLMVEGPVYVACGGSLDATGRGYSGQTSYPGESVAISGTGGSHIGQGGPYSSYVPGSTYGSVYFPLEAGAGGGHTGSGLHGGGVVVVQATEMVVDGTVRANGESQPTGGYRGGAGGSIWLDIDGSLSGGGTVEVVGGEVPGGYGAGAGGVIAIYHSGLGAGLAQGLQAQGSAEKYPAGAGSVYLFGPTSTYGDLVIDAGSVADGITDLPSLGAGTAQAGSAGTRLETDLASIQPFFVGHWVEIYDATGALEGTWRVESIDGTALVLDTGATTDVGDTWQGVYRFDNVDLMGDIELRSDDPIRVGGEQVIDGLVETEQVSAHDLVLRTGSTLGHPETTDAADPKRLEIALTGRLTVESGATIDVSAMGYRPHQTYPGEMVSANGSGASHLGVGGQYTTNLPGSAYGSVYFPAEPGAGGNHTSWGLAGGGVVIVEAADVVLDGAILARGEGRATGGYRGGAGGSIWIQASGQVGGTGSLDVSGGEVPGGYGAGGGGILAVYHGGLDSALEQSLAALGGATKYAAGAGAIYLHGPTSTWGDLRIDAGSVADGITDLPSLGSGVAQSGSSASRLETDRTSIQPFFVGHWVEVYSSGGALEGTWRVVSIDGPALVLETGATVDVGDVWQGVYRFDDVSLSGDIELRSDDPLRVSGTHEIAGAVELGHISGHDLVLRAGSSLTQPATSDPNQPRRLEIELSGDLVIESGAAIDVTGKGFARGITHPDAEMPGNGNGGFHIGHGGFYSGAVGTTYGSVYFPWEPGGGGDNIGYGSAGGGVVFISTAGSVQIDGLIRADGETRTGGSRRGGAGGSVWIDAVGAVGGSGTISAQGSTATGSVGAGGGGAIAIYHGGIDLGFESRLYAQGGALDREGGAGSVFLAGPLSTYGDLIVDTGSLQDGITELPALGSGTAQAGTSGNRLETTVGTIPEYFVGHWVELYDGATGFLEGTWRVVAVDGGALILETGATADVGDAWHGVYRFDNVDLAGDIELRSADPIRVSGTQEIVGTLEVNRITGHDLVLRAGATLTLPATASPSQPEALTIDLTGDLVIEAAATIDVTGKGYGAHATYPGEVLPGNGGGGHHMGRGGYYSGVEGTTFGSVYRPQESGSGGDNSGYGRPGGGVLRITANDLVLEGADSRILANGAEPVTGWNRGGAGGSIWATLSGLLSGDGVIEAKGGSAGANLIGSGGGGAIAIEHQGIVGDIADRLLAYGGAVDKEGGAGTVYLLGPASTYGDLIVDNADVLGGWTELPSLGAGTAEAASAADVLVTDLAAAVQPYFVGHWVEIYDGTTFEIEGTYRVAEILPDGASLVLAPNGADTPTVDPGDLWQGVYLFDDVLLTGDAMGFESEDPLLVIGTQTVRGALTTERLFGNSLVLDTDAILTHPPEDGASRGLDIRISGDLTIGSGAAIDVSGQGYGPRLAYPGAAIPGGGGGGSHLGLGGYSPGTTYGSVARPWEHGGGGEHSSAGGNGGGRLRIQARDLLFADATGAIVANGLSTTSGSARGGAGGSIWIELTGQLEGDGSIGAIGGESASSHGSGGGGAVAIYHQGATGTALANAAAWGGDHTDIGGAGTLFIHGPASTEGDLFVRSAGTAGRDTVLPSLGSGTALTGSSDATLVTDLASEPPGYFVGHFVEISTSGGTVEGVFPITGISGTTLLLSDDDGVMPSVDETDTWRGIYRFDSVTVENATVTSADGVFESGTEVVP